MELTYTPRTINEIEIEAKKPIQDVLSDFSVKTLLLLVRKGLNVDEDQAEKAMGDYLKDGNDTMSLYTLILKKLQESGFLPRVLDLDKIIEEMNESIKSGI